MATTVEMLLQRLMAQNGGGVPPVPDPAQPVPLAPVGNLGPLSNDTSAAFAAQNPEPVPPALSAAPAPDMNFVDQYAGPRPSAPAPQNADTLQRIALALQGFGAGVQGQGPQFLGQLDAQRRAPIEQYERQLRDFEERRTRGLEIAEGRSERQATQANRAAELAYQRDYNTYLKKLGIRQDEADERTRQAFEVYKLDRQAKREEARELERERRDKETLAKQITSRYFTVTKNQALSQELGRFHAGLSDRPLSAGAAKLDAQVQGIGEARMGRAAGGGGTGGGASQKALTAAQEIQSIKDKMVEAEARGDQQTVKQLLMRAKSAIRLAARYPDIEAGFDQSGKWPYVKLRTAQGSVALPGVAAQGQQPQSTLSPFAPGTPIATAADIEEFAKRTYGSVTPENIQKAKDEAMKAGFGVQ